LNLAVPLFNMLILVQIRKALLNLVQDSHRLALNFYKRALPLFRELATNSFLTAATAFIIGLVVARY
jgi:hypothetical protein